MHCRMSRTLCLALCAVLAVSSSARAATITWFASNEVQTVSPLGEIFWPGLVPGTPWSLTVSFDPSAAPLSTPTPGCNSFPVAGSTLTLGSYSYSYAGGGTAWTNAALPAIGCIGVLPEGEAGLVQFTYSTSQWLSDDPGAWDLGLSTFMAAGYYDQLVKDGSLPTIPTWSPGRFGGFVIESPFGPELGLYGGDVQFELVDAAVPEPASMTLLGAGLAALIARRRLGRP
jgi:hypothetical protein